MFDVYPLWICELWKLSTTEFVVVMGKLGLSQICWTKLACGLLVLVDDRAAKDVEDENPDDVAMEKTCVYELLDVPFLVYIYLYLTMNLWIICCGSFTSCTFFILLVTRYEVLIYEIGMIGNEVVSIKDFLRSQSVCCFDTILFVISNLMFKY